MIFKDTSHSGVMHTTIHPCVSGLFDLAPSRLIQAVVAHWSPWRTLLCASPLIIFSQLPFWEVDKSTDCWTIWNYINSFNKNS